MIENFEDIKIGDLLSLDPKSLEADKEIVNREAVEKLWSRDNIAIVYKKFLNEKIEIIWLINPGRFQNPGILPNWYVKKHMKFSGKE
jgi:hypothetical protein